jgi:DNA sulfur modification protein DndC
MRQPTLFDEYRLSLDDSIELTKQSLQAYGAEFDHWAIAYSGGKDSTALLTIVLFLIRTGQITPPKSLKVLYADTRQELPPLHNTAMKMLKYCRDIGYEAECVVAPLEKRFWPYILGRGVPSPNNGTLRWCTRQIKGEPMQDAVESLGKNTLMLTGVRLGESAARDNRISISCSKDGGECGQGYFQSMAGDRLATLAPLIHWRVCHIWDWIVVADVEHGYPVVEVAEAYGMTESIENGDEPINARTGCIGCPLVSTVDTALERLLKNPKWAYLSPLRKISAVHLMARDRSNRLRKVGGETKKDGSLVANQGRFGPVTLEVRLKMLEILIEIQREVNVSALQFGRPLINILNPEEEAFIRESIELKVFPDKWTGDEIVGSTLIDEPLDSLGNIQPLLWEMK